MASGKLPFSPEPKDYKWGVIYYAPQDPCPVRPKRNPSLGWTINFAHRLAWPMLMAFVGVAAAPTLIGVALCLAMGRIGLPIILAVTPISVIGTIALAIWLSDRPFYNQKNIGK